MYNLALSFMSIFMMAGAGDKVREQLGTDWAWVADVVDAVDIVLWPILIVVGAAGMIYSVILGVNMARADSTDKREEAKKRLLNVIIGLAIIIALILFFKLFINSILPAFFS